MSYSCTGAGQSVVFDYAEWSTRYPEFAPTVTAPQAQMLWTEATLYLDNTPYSPVLDGSVGGQRDLLLNMLTAHIAQIYFGSAQGAVSGGVGRLAEARQGSEKLSLAFPETSNAAQAWFCQTKYGASFWAATACYRSGQYVANPTAPRNGFPLYYPGLGVWGWKGGGE